MTAKPMILALAMTLILPATPVWAAGASSPAASPEPTSPDIIQLDADAQRLRQQLAAEKRQPLLAGLLSLLVPGVGQIYNGDPMRGLGVLGGAAGVFAASTLLAGFLVGLNSPYSYAPAVFISAAAMPSYWVWGATDAYYQAELKNNRLDAQIQSTLVCQPQWRTTLLRF